jgi:hypothetical protein
MCPQDGNVSISRRPRVVVVVVAIAVELGVELPRPSSQRNDPSAWNLMLTVVGRALGDRERLRHPNHLRSSRRQADRS